LLDITWYELQGKLAQVLNIYPTSLQAQYHLSTDVKNALPYDLTYAKHLKILVTLWCPLIVPPIIDSGHCSICQMKPVTVQLANKGDDSFNIQDGRKVCISKIMQLLYSAIYLEIQ
jgi:hypothetical protein